MLGDFLLVGSIRKFRETFRVLFRREDATLGELDRVVTSDNACDLLTVTSFDIEFSSFLDLVSVFINFISSFAENDVFVCECSVHQILLNGLIFIGIQSWFKDLISL